MKDEELIIFKAIIDGNVFPIQIPKDEEEAARELMREVNDKLNFFRNNYKNRKMTDWLSMSLLDYAFETNKLRKGVLKESVVNQLDDLEKRLSQLVN